MAAEKTDAKQKTAEPGKKRLTGIIVVAALMALEGVGVFMLAKAISPEPVSTLAINAEGDTDGTKQTGDDDYAEIEIAECRPSNVMTGKFVTFHIRVSALVAADDVERAEGIVRSRRARLEDAVNTVIRSSDPKHFTEPGLESIKRRLKHEFDTVFGDNQLIRDVLIPQMLQSGPGV